MAFYRARLTTPNFSFEAYGPTKTTAKAALKHGLQQHEEQYVCARGWYQNDDIEIDELTMGAAYRDNQEM